MRSALRSCLAALLLSSAGLTIASAAEPGYFDFGSFSPAGKGEFVEINLQEGLIKFAARVAAKTEPEAAEILRNLKRVRVNVIELDESNRAATTERIEKIRAELSAQGWEQVVTVKGNKEDDVAIYMKMRTGEIVEGLVVTVIDHDREAVLVNIVGQINPDQLSELADRLNLHELKGHKFVFRH